MQSSLLADDDVDLVDSVAGLREILTNIATTVDDDDDDNEKKPLSEDRTQDEHSADGLNVSLDSHPLDDSQQPLDSTGDVNLSLDNHTLDVQSADSSIDVVNGKNITEMDEKSNEKLENTSEMEIKCTGNDAVLDGEKKYSEMIDGNSEETPETERKFIENDEVMMEDENSECEHERTTAANTELMHVDDADVLSHHPHHHGDDDAAAAVDGAVSKKVSVVYLFICLFIHRTEAAHITYTKHARAHTCRFMALFIGTPG